MIFAWVVILALLAILFAVLRLGHRAAIRRLSRKFQGAGSAPWHEDAGAQAALAAAEQARQDLDRFRRQAEENSPFNPFSPSAMAEEAANQLTMQPPPPGFPGSPF